MGNIDITVLEGIGKNARKRYMKGELSESDVLRMYKKNLKECSDYPEYGVPLNEMIADLRSCHNPLLCKKLEFLISEFKRKRTLSTAQNKVSLDILNNMKASACGIGLRNVEKFLDWQKDTSLENCILYYLLKLEWTNLAAKQYHKPGRVIYNHKERILIEIEPLLRQAGWKYGVNEHAGKNASGIIYVYLPNGDQLSWHCGYQMYELYPTIDAEWDGRACSTLTKIVDYINSTGLLRYGNTAA